MQFIRTLGRNFHIKRRWIALPLLWISFFLGSTLAYAAHSFIQSQSYWVGENPDAQASRTWHPYKGLLALGYGSEPVWIQLSVSPKAGQNPDDLIEINMRPGYLDQIDLYDPLQTGSQPKSVGDRFDWRNNVRPNFSYNFYVPAGNEPREIRLRIKTQSARLIEIRSLSRLEALTIDREIHTRLDFIIFTLGAFFLWSIYNAWMHPRALAKSFVLVQFASLLYAINVLGYTRVYLSGYLSPETLDLLTSIGAFALTFFSFSFYYLLLSEYKLKRWAQITLLALLTIEVLAFCMYLSGVFWVALMINAQLSMLGCWLLWSIAIWGIFWQQSMINGALLPKKIVIGYFTLLLLANTLHILSIFGWGFPDLISVYAGTHNGIFTGIFLIALLHLRNKTREQQVVSAAIEADKERQLRRQQSEFMDMLAHELKSPLSTISLALDQHGSSPRLRNLANRGVENIQTVINRCTQVNAIKDHEHVLETEEINLESMVADLISNHPEAARFQLTHAGNHDISADKTLLAIVVGNLMDNAIKYGNESSLIHICITAEPVTETLILEVSNDIGKAGLPDPEKLFEKHYRSAKAHHQTGSGLGLYLSRNILQRHGGDISYATKNQQVIFRITLPYQP